MTILVTGARGHIARAVIDRLAPTGATIRATTGGDPNTLDTPPGVDRRHLDLSDPTDLDTVFAGVTTAFLYTRPDGIDRILAAAKRHGVEHLVLLSSATVIEPEADTNMIAIMHRRTEEAVAASGSDFTVVRPGHLAHNALQWAPSIRDGDEVRLPFPEAAVNPIHAADVAEVAAAILAAPSHRGGHLDLTGPAGMTHREQVSIIARGIGRPLRVIEIDEATATAERPPGLPEPVFAQILRMTRRGLTVPPLVNDSVATATGHPPRNFGQWVADHRAAFGEPR